ncbi:GNAT family N-acetyltransferase [Robiginitalea marina]|uniref:GNAT family N-acetyltransferase n=1 Tax=Robiginitalea marina TaxID=2954105 RepID=A0ABT1B0K1_9FLAO|nr:GNAT family N-acetyltransferase [Robiginitalea marina]MCO5725777.1 GNAT family N-acetyltransferase [Robiginitalea marina]
MIRQAKIRDIPDILALTDQCATALQRQGIHQWNAHYPSEHAFRSDVERAELWVLEQEGALIGTIVLSTLMDPEYRDVQWLSPDDNNRYVHRLAVHPGLQGKGFARKLMDFAEGKAAREGAVSIRLDTFSQNLRNQRFYEARGYQRLGNVFFPKQSPLPFYCYELLLSSPGEPRTNP